MNTAKQHQQQELFQMNTVSGGQMLLSQQQQDQITNKIKN